MKGSEKTQMNRLFLLGVFLFVVTHGSLVSYNRTYNGYTYMLPLQSSTDANGQLAYSAQMNNFTEAQRWCESSVTGSTLATISSEIIQKNINNFVQTATQEMGIFDLMHVRVGGKARDLWIWVNGKVLKGHAVVEWYKGSSGAITANKTRRFVSGEYNVKRSYICEYSTNIRGSCHANESGRCYVVTNASVFWMEARSRCIKEGGDLASFDNLEDDTAFDAFVRKLSLVSNWQYWVGIQKVMYSLWDKTDYRMNYTNWRLGHISKTPRDLCVTLYFPNNEYEEKGKWTASNCSDILPFICEIRNDPVTSSLTSVTGKKSNDPDSVTSSLTSATKNESNAPDYGFVIGLVIGLGVSLPLLFIIGFLGFLLWNKIQQLKRCHQEQILSNERQASNSEKMATTGLMTTPTAEAPQKLNYEELIIDSEGKEANEYEMLSQ